MKKYCILALVFIVSTIGSGGLFSVSEQVLDQMWQFESVFLGMMDETIEWRKGRNQLDEISNEVIALLSVMVMEAETVREAQITIALCSTHYAIGLILASLSRMEVEAIHIAPYILDIGSDLLENLQRR